MLQWDLGRHLKNVNKALREMGAFENLQESNRTFYLKDISMDLEGVILGVRKKVDVNIEFKFFNLNLFSFECNSQSF